MFDKLILKKIFFNLVIGSEQSAIRYFIQTILMVLIARYNNVSIFGIKEHRNLLLVRGVFGAINFISFGFSLKFINPSDTQVIIIIKS